MEIDGTDTRRKHKLTAGTVKNVHPCTFFTCEICSVQISLLIYTTDIHVRSGTLRIISSGTDAIVQKYPSVDISELRVFHKRKTRYCMEPLTACQRSDTVDVLYIAKKSLLEIDDADARSV